MTRSDEKRRIDGSPCGQSGTELFSFWGDVRRSNVCSDRVQVPFMRLACL
jgi:hypothetical protein